jgi:hypothetical protein
MSGEWLFGAGVFSLCGDNVERRGEVVADGV